LTQRPEIENACAFMHAPMPAPPSRWRSAYSFAHSRFTSSLQAALIAAEGSAGRARCGSARSASVAIRIGQMRGWSCQGMFTS